MNVGPIMLVSRHRNSTAQHFSACLRRYTPPPSTHSLIALLGWTATGACECLTNQSTQDTYSLDIRPLGACVCKVRHDERVEREELEPCAVFLAPDWVVIPLSPQGAAFSAFTSRL